MRNNRVWLLRVVKGDVKLVEYSSSSPSLILDEKKLKKKKAKKVAVIVAVSALVLALTFNLVFAATIEENLHLNIQTTDATGAVTTGTYAFVFNISTTSNCSAVVYTDSVNLTTDSRGIISYYLENVSLDYDQQYWLCYYRDGTLKNASKIARTPYTFRARNVTISGLEADANLNLSDYNITADTGFLNLAWSYLTNIPNILYGVWSSNNADGLLISNGTAIGYNQTVLNITIDARENDTLADLSCSNDQVAKWNLTSGQWECSDVSSPGAGDIDAVNTNGPYLTGGQTSGTVNLLLNETVLNQTINALENDTTYTAGTGLILSGTQFSFNTTYGDDKYYNKTLANATFIKQSEEANLNVNSSEWWLTSEGALNNVADILGSWINNNLNWINATYGNTTYILQDNEANLNVNASDFLDGYDSSFFMPLNQSVYGTFDFNGGWTGGGLSIDGGDLYAQTVYVYNITSLNVTEQNLTIVDDLIVFGNTELKKNLTVDSGTLFVDSNTDMVGIGTSSPSQVLDVVGGIQLGDTSNAEAGAMKWTGAEFQAHNGTAWNAFGASGGGSLWSQNGSNIYFNTGNVGINTSTPQNTLNVIGDGNITGAFYLLNSKCSSGDVLTTNTTTGLISCVTDQTGGGGASPWTNDSTQIFVDIAGGYPNYINASDTLFVNGSNNRVGIGDTTPGEELEVAGDINATGGDICITGGNCLSLVGGGGSMNNWTIAGDSGSTVVTDQQTVTIAGSGTIDTSESSRTVNVSVQADSIDDAQIVNDGIGAGSIATGGVETAEILDDTITELDLNLDNAAVDGDILVYDSTGTNFIWQTCAEITGSSDLCDSGDAINDADSNIGNEYPIAGNDIDVSTRTVNIESTLDYVTTINSITNIYDDAGSSPWLEVSSCGADTGVSSVSAAGTITCTADSASDNYGDWDLYTDGTERDSIISAEDVGFDSGNGVTVSWDGSRDVGFDFDCSDVTDSGNDGVSCSTQDIVVGAGDGLDVSTTALSVDVTDIIGDGLAETSNNLIFDCSDVDGTGIGCSGEDLTITGGTCITADVSGVSVTGDCIGDTQLAYNTGQALTTGSSPTFAGLTLNGNLDMNQNDIVDLDKIDANTYDPVYDIDGTKYATYLSGVAGGVKEEVTGTVMLNSDYTIDFKNLEVGSDLWLFYQITDFGSEMENLQIILTPSFNGNVWYGKNPSEKTLKISGTQLE
jgi:hypothetical protein